MGTLIFCQSLCMATDVSDVCRECVFIWCNKYPIYYDNPPATPYPSTTSPGLADTQMEGFMSGYFNILLFRYW